MAELRQFTPNDVERLKPGDCLLYSGSSFISRAIKIKTWSHVSHVEIYRGDFKSIASRDQVGVNTYSFRYDGLYEVRRPNSELDMGEALRWFDTPFDPVTKTGTTGQKYDTWGLFRFFTLGKQSTDKQFCSEVATRFYRKCVELPHGHDFHPFHPDWDADLIAPCGYEISDEFTVMWNQKVGWTGLPMAA